VYLVKNIN